ncbi:MAG: right-handed parallel beta-helix repeat-containing protein, partial [Lachnospiraceae bacterium]|nr:right-handed parallel beta-helix repeat-containing protein [Lachnospiraceae bacterium]
IVDDCIGRYYENGNESWHSLKLYESHFANVFSNVVAGGEVKNTPLLEVKKCLFEKCYFGFVGNSAEMIFSRCEFIDTKYDAINIGCDDNCQAEVLIDSCRIINSGWYGFQCYMDGSEVSITNSEIYGSGWEDVKTLRQRYSNYYSKLHFENNVFGSPEFGGSGVIVDASHTVLRNNVFYGINGVSDYLGVNAYALYDQGSDTLLIEQNSFGFKGEEKFPNKHGDLWLESELGYNLKFWIKDGCYYDPDPKITIRNNTFMQSLSKAVRVDSTRLNVTLSENLFLETKDSAICNVKPLSIPVISNVSKQGDNIIVAGKVDSIATIELFYTSGAPQTAEAFLGRVETDSDGGFSFSIPVENVKDKGSSLCFTTTATYPCRATSNLSEVYCATFNDSKIADNVSSKIIVLTPNPVSSYLKTGIAEDVSYQIYSVDGCLVMSGRTVGGTIEVSHLLQGIYWLRLIDGKEVKVAKFVKESTMN